MRNELNQHGVENLYVRRDRRTRTGVACQYKDPRFGFKEFTGVMQYRGLGSDVTQAIETARKLNACLIPLVASAKVTLIVNTAKTSSKSIKLSSWLSQYTAIQEEKLKSGALKPNTWKVRRGLINRINKAHGKYKLETINTKLVKAFLDTYIKEGKVRSAQAVRSVYIDIFTEAAQAGEVESMFNPAKTTKKPVAKVTKSRLSLSQFEQISAQFDYEPFKLASLLALVTAQRRTDLCLLRKFKGSDWEERLNKYKENPNHFIDTSDAGDSFQKLVKFAPYSYIENDYLYVFQLKTGKLLKIPLALKLNVIDQSIHDVIKLTHHNIKSDFVLHHTACRSKAKIGDAVSPILLTRHFKNARDKTGIKWTCTPASFHEIRSLSERLYREQGIDTRLLCGHSEQKMTDAYNDLRGSDWQIVKI